VVECTALERRQGRKLLESSNLSPSAMTKYYVAVFFGVVVFLGVALFKTPEATNFEKGEFGGVSLNIELALSDAAREKGLSGRASLPADYAMLFVFPHSEYYGFWMKDTLVPLDLFWLDDKGQVVSIAARVATSTYPNVFKPTAPALYVLETNAGFAELHHIATGTALHLQSLPTVFK
jgi:uncharacterized protein